MNWKKNLDQNDLMTAKTLIEANEQIAIFSHIHPDGDTTGAQLGLASVLKQMGKDIVLYNTHEKVETFSFLEGFNEIQIFHQGDPLPLLVITLDCGSLDRLNLSADVFKGHQLIGIDHHAGNTHFADINIVAPDASSTCEMMAAFVQAWSWPITSGAATAFYTGISTDTGSFRYEKTTAHTMRLGAWLMEQGADHDLVRFHVTENTSKAKFMLMQEVYARTRFAADGEIAYTILSYDLLQQIGVPDDELHGIASIIKEVEGVEVSMLCRELPDGKSKISLRSKVRLDCNAVASKLGGGGHERAAGAVLDLPLEEAAQQVTRLLNEALAS